MTTKLFFFLLIAATQLSAQDGEIDRLVEGELRMTFPSIYFKNNSTEYAAMPYTIDSCFKYIAKYKEDIVSYLVWRDSTEPENLTDRRIKKLRMDLNKYAPSRGIYFESMGKEQKISRRTISKGEGFEQTQYLLSLNSVLDICRTGDPILLRRVKKNSHMEGKLWCWKCWKYGRNQRRLFGKRKS